jgi:hypothetical protein
MSTPADAKAVPLTEIHPTAAAASSNVQPADGGSPTSGASSLSAPAPRHYTYFFVDTDGDRLISFDEFKVGAAGFLQFAPLSNPPLTAKQLFDRLDVDHGQYCPEHALGWLLGWFCSFVSSRARVAISVHRWQSDRR